MIALRYIVRLIMAQMRCKCLPDVEGYKQRRCEGLRNLALRLADRVKSQRSFTMEPMPALNGVLTISLWRITGCSPRKQRRNP